VRVTDWPVYGQLGALYKALNGLPNIIRTDRRAAAKRTRARAKAVQTSFNVLGSLTLGLLNYATGDAVAIPTDRATVAQWRQARSEAIHHNDMRSLQVYKVATNF
jgi:hypothetical protein